MDKTTFDFLNNTFPTMPTFYALLKVYKDLRNQPGRPIVSGINSLIRNGSIIVDYYFKPLVCKLPSFLKNTMNLLNILKDMNGPPNTILASINVESLYFNIPHVWGLEVIDLVVGEIALFSI